MMDAPELFVDIEPGAGRSVRLRVTMEGGAPIEDEVERRLPTFPPADLDALRNGGASERVTDALAQRVTGWLLRDDLRRQLGTAVRASPAPLRIVIRAHPKVLAEIGDVPFELLRLDADPLVLQQRVRAIVHMARGAVPEAASATRSGWPLGVLLVRANPTDLGGAVPPALPLRDRIRAIAADRGLGQAVEVTALTSEPGGSGPVTYDRFRRALRSGSVGVLVYLGHGDLLDAGLEGLPPVGALQFESEGSPYASPIRADQLRSELSNHPVPLALLAGCLTATSDAIARRLPQWMRGHQSVAEALVYGEAGVRCAVGMRYRLETTDADRFLSAFFQSLIADAPGDVERAVRAGREDLFAQKPYPPSWSAAVVYRAAAGEPLFPWMESAPGLFDPLDAHDELLREESWRALSALDRGAPPESRAFPRRLLAQMAAGFLARWRQRGVSVIWPQPVEARPGETVRAGVALDRALDVSSLHGRLRFPDAISAVGARPSPALRAAGFGALFGLDQPGEVRFLLQSRDGTPATMPDGDLFEIDLAIPAGAPAVHPLAIGDLDTRPRAPLRGWTGAVVTSP